VNKINKISKTIEAVAGVFLIGWTAVCCAWFTISIVPSFIKSELHQISDSAFGTRVIANLMVCGIVWGIVAFPSGVVWLVSGKLKNK